MVEQNNNVPSALSKNAAKLPIGSAKDVEFSKEYADQDDLEAVHRAEAASKRIAANKEE